MDQTFPLYVRFLVKPCKGIKNNVKNASLSEIKFKFIDSRLVLF